MNLMEAMSMRRTGGSAPQQEYLLQGSILNESCENLLHKLRGFCDNADTPYEEFIDHEIVLTIRSPSGSTTSLRLRKALDQPTHPWHLRYLGQPNEVGDNKRPTLIRNCIDCSTSGNVVQFLLDMGFQVDYEFVFKGYLFRKGRMKVVVAKMFRLVEPGIVTTTEPISKSYLVELSVVAPAGQEGLAEEIKQFAEQLKPLVQLEKIDARSLKFP